MEMVVEEAVKSGTTNSKGSSTEGIHGVSPLAGLVLVAVVVEVI